MADKQIKDFIVTTELTDTMNIATEDVSLTTPLTRRFSLTALKNYILQNVSSAWAGITGKPFTTIDSNTLDTTTVGEVIILKVKDSIYANASTATDLTTHTGDTTIHTTTAEKTTWNNKANVSDLTNKLTQADIIQGDNITLVKSGESNQITISSSIPTGSTTVIGGYKVGTNLSVLDGVLSATGTISGDVAWTNVTSKPFASVLSTQFDVTDTVLQIKTGIYEPFITTKNTGFNLALGTTSGTVAEGNHTHSNYATKSTTSNATLTSATWAGTTAPYSYTLSLTGVTTTNVIEVIPQSSITTAQEESLALARISNGTQTTDSITLLAYGTKPTIDIPIIFIIRGDM